MIGRVVPVGLLTSYVRTVLEGDALLADVWAEGEVSNLFRAQSGHVYFTVTDGDGQLKCALFRSHAMRQRRLPQTGDHVAVHGRVTVYERDGALQLYADVVQPAGLGLLALQLERLRQRLEAEGLFDGARKRPLPAAPRVIGVITSPDGAVWHDIQNVLRRRYPLAEVILAPSTVQGDRAPGELVAALEAIQLEARVEVVILARGGGSAEDLWAFNDERVARAVFACRVPVVSGVGHETDWTIVDDVADLRAPTPSAAAELCVPAVAEIAARLIELRERLDRGARASLDESRVDLGHLSHRLCHYSPARHLAGQRRIATELARRAARRERSLLMEAWSRVALQSGLLQALDPRAVLGRGYAALSDAETGASVGRVAATGIGQALRADLIDGVIVGRVESVRPTPVAWLETSR